MLKVLRQPIVKQNTILVLRALNILTGTFIATTIVMGALLTYGVIE